MQFSQISLFALLIATLSAAAASDPVARDVVVAKAGEVSEKRNLIERTPKKKSSGGGGGEEEEEDSGSGSGSGMSAAYVSLDK